MPGCACGRSRRRNPEHGRGMVASRGSDSPSAEGRRQERADLSRRQGKSSSAALGTAAWTLFTGCRPSVGTSCIRHIGKRKHVKCEFPSPWRIDPGRSEEDAGHLAAVGHRRRARDLRRVFRLELRLGEGRDAGLSGHVGLRRGDVHDVHLQLHRTHHLDSARGRALRLRQAGVRPVGGYIAGMATLVEFVFAPPAISLAIGAYLHIQFPGFRPPPRRWAPISSSCR